jgi:hypothetical protein
MNHDASGLAKRGRKKGLDLHESPHDAGILLK